MNGFVLAIFVFDNTFKLLPNGLAGCAIANNVVAVATGSIPEAWVTVPNTDWGIINIATLLFVDEFAQSTNVVLPAKDIAIEGWFVAKFLVNPNATYLYVWAGFGSANQ